MERKLELVDICMYLPYGLEVTTREYKSSEIIGFVMSINDVHISENMLTFSNNKLGSDTWDIPEFVPVLRPMSDLTKTMTHPDINNGEEFLPLVELAKLHIRLDYSGYSVNECEFKQVKDVEMGDIVCISGVISTIYYISNYYSIAELQLLSKLHFDFNDLIGQGLAVDRKTFKNENPK